MNPFLVLGVASNCSIDTAKKAYRRLAQQHHPDHGGNEATFKQIKAAWELIEGGYRQPVENPNARYGTSNNWTRPEPPGGTWRDRDDIGSIFEELKKANRAAAPNAFGNFSYQHDNSELVMQVTPREAFSGYSVVVERRAKNDIERATVFIPPGLPDGYRGKYSYTTNSGTFTAIITSRIRADAFKIRGLSDQDNLFSAGLYPGDIELDLEIDAIDLITGTWLTVQDFLGESLKVRVPAGFNPLNRLKISNKGYYGWLHEYGRPSTARQHMYVRLKPVFKAPPDIERQKIINLYNSVQGMGDES